MQLSPSQIKTIRHQFDALCRKVLREESRNIEKIRLRRLEREICFTGLSEYERKKLLVTDEYSFGLQIGDGKCVYIDADGKFSEPIPWDENCQLNVTTSICDSDAIDEFRYFVTENTPTAVFIGSDGIDDSYASDEELYALYRSILKIFIENGLVT